jgi:hypothetical protein
MPLTSNDTGSAPQDQPNSTTALNGGAGIRCLNNSSLDSRLGTLNGVGGPLSLTASCVNSLIP